MSCVVQAAPPKKAKKKPAKRVASIPAPLKLKAQAACASGCGAGGVPSALTLQRSPYVTSTSAVLYLGYSLNTAQITIYCTDVANAGQYSFSYPVTGSVVITISTLSPSCYYQ